MAEATPRFGEQPLPQTVAAAGALRRLNGSTAVSWNTTTPPSTRCSRRFADWERELAAAVPADPTPRIGQESTRSQRVYLDHAFDVGAYNPCFPEYTFDHLDDRDRVGARHLPVVYEGRRDWSTAAFSPCSSTASPNTRVAPPGRTGKTRSLTVTFRRPTPILTELGFDIVRSEDRRAGHVDGAAAARRRGALHRRIQARRRRHRTS